MAEAARKLEPEEEFVRAKADSLLEAIGTVTESIAKMSSQYCLEAAALGRKFKPAHEKAKADLKKLETRLEKLCKTNHRALFTDGDRADLVHGALLFAVLKRVKRAKKVLEELERIGATEAIITVKSVDWDVLEGWTDERLIEVGTERKKEDKYSYELTGRPKAEGGKKGRTKSQAARGGNGGGVK